VKLSEIKISPIIESIQLLDISDKEYFGDKYKNYISNSRLNLLKYNDSPDKFFEGLQENMQYSDSLLFGSAIHELVLQPESFYLVPNVNRPTAKAGLMADELYRPDGVIPTYKSIKAASEKLDYYKASMNSDKAKTLIGKCEEYWKTRSEFEKQDNLPNKEFIFLSEKERTKIDSCLKALKNSKEIIELLNPKGTIQDPLVKNENAILMDVLVETPNDSFILKLKSKLDNFTIDFDTSTIIVNDLKTTGKYITEFNQAIERFSYYREMAMYSWLLKLYVQKTYNWKETKIKSNFLVVETIPEYYTKVFPMTKSLFNKGIKELSRLLKLAAFYSCNGYDGLREERKANI
jgi:hypothetical protein